MEKLCEMLAEVKWLSDMVIAIVLVFEKDVLRLVVDKLCKVKKITLKKRNVL